MDYSASQKQTNIIDDKFVFTAAITSGPGSLRAL